MPRLILKSAPDGHGNPTFLDERYRVPVPGEVTPAQAESGNYKKPRVAWQGLQIALENPAGTVRKGKGWETLMLYDYGYIVGSMGVDGDPVDVYLGPHLHDAPMVYVIHQRKYGDWSAYDEDKCMIGWLSQQEAEQAYLQHYDDERFLGPVTAMPVGKFVEKVKGTAVKAEMIKGGRVVFLKATPAGAATCEPTMPLILFLKSQIRGYTRKDGVYVKPHADKRRAAEAAGQGDLFRPARAERPAGEARPNPYKGKDPELDVPDLFTGKTRREEAAGAPTVQFDDELLKIATKESKAVGGLLWNALETDVQGVIPGKTRTLDKYLANGRVTEDEIKEAFAQTRAKLKERYGDTMTMWRADAPVDKHTADNRTVYMAGEDIAKEYARNGRVAKPFLVHIDDVLAVYAKPSGYYEAIVKLAPSAAPLAKSLLILKSTQLDSLIAEHERLVGVLNSPSHDDDAEEAQRQAKELEGYRKERARRRTASSPQSA